MTHSMFASINKPDLHKEARRRLYGIF